MRTGKGKRAWMKWKDAQTWRNTRTLPDDALKALTDSLRETAEMASAEGFEDIASAAYFQGRVCLKVLEERGLFP